MMDDDIRVRAESRFADLFDSMKRSAVSEFHELFFLGACLAFSRGEKKKLKRPEDRFWSKTITPHEWSCYYAMYLSQHGMDFAGVANDKQLIRWVEEYANAGMEILIDETLSEYLVGAKENPRVDKGGQKNEIAKIVLGEIFALSASTVETRQEE